MQYKKINYLMVVVFMMFAACTNDKPTEKTTQKPERKAVQIPKFDKDSAYAYVAKQISFGPRVTNSEGHAACKAWIIDKMKSYGANVIEQDFETEAYTGTIL